MEKSYGCLVAVQVGVLFVATGCRTEDSEPAARWASERMAIAPDTGARSDDALSGRTPGDQFGALSGDSMGEQTWNGASSPGSRPTRACSGQPGCSACLVIRMLDGNRTTEGGKAVRILVGLTTRPRGMVTVHASSTDRGEGVPSGTALFHPTDWRRAQDIVVTGQPDHTDDGDQAYRIRLSIVAPEDLCYQRIRVPDVRLINQDDDTAGVLAVLLAPAVTSEQGGQVPVKVSLASAPTAAVTVHLTVTAPSEAMVSPTALVFTPRHWDTPQVAVVRGLGDLLADGTVPYELVVSIASSDPRYADLPARQFAFENLDGPAFAGTGASDSVAVSADGRTVVGYRSVDSESRATRWRPETGLVLLDGASAEARGVSGTGDVIAGMAQGPDGRIDPVRWVNGVGPEVLPEPTAAFKIAREVTAVSTNGSVVGGAGHYLTSPVDFFGLIWTGDPVRATPFPCEITALNEDGSLASGFARPGRELPHDIAMRNNVMLPLPMSDDRFCSGDLCLSCISGNRCASRAYGISRDGATVVGYVVDQISGRSAAMRWTFDAAGAVTNTVLSTQHSAQATAVSGDGQVVVGLQGTDGALLATRWTDGQSASIADLLIQAGVHLEGWTLTLPRAASNDGQVIVGTGVNPKGEQEGWMAVMPPR